ncbi:MAG: class GN sortase [Myxococcota bacterium]
MLRRARGGRPRLRPGADVAGRAVVVLAALAGLALLARGAWIPAKAAAAQWLLGHAWERALAGEPRPRPWPWADTWPVARLEVPRLGVDLIVLAGASGSSLAFGPGHWTGTALPGADGHGVIAGHRDTHFAFLRSLEPGETLLVTAPGRPPRRYRVTESRVVLERDPDPLVAAGRSSLALVTCFPFGAWAPPGGPERFVVWATGEGPPGPPPGAPDSGAGSRDLASHHPRS